MRYYIVIYNILNILPFVFNKRTPILRTAEGISDASSEVGNNLHLANAVEHKEANIVSEDESNELSTDTLGQNIKQTVANIPNDFGDDSVKEALSQKNENCWMSLNAKQHFQIMDNLDERFRKTRSDYQQQLGEELDKKMLDTLVQWRGVAQREAFKTSGNTNLIPAGLNLGGYCMMKMKDSLLFFHRIKLRNQTHFRVNYLHTDVENMALVMQLSLNDLHLLGAYERSHVDNDPSVLFYAPTFGEVEFLLKNVDYKMEARLRLLNNKLIIELVTSKLNIEDILMMYTNRADYSKPIRLMKDSIEDFLDRMKTDLDDWLKDYFNDYLTYFVSLKTPNSEFMKAEKYKTIALNEYADSSLNIIRDRLRHLRADTVKIPHFTIYGPNKMKLELKDGSLRGLDSIYRRSVTTAKKDNDIRKVNLIVGFSNLKVMYKYEASLRMDDSPLNGIIVLSADEITAHMELSLVKDSETVDLEFNFIQQMKPESLTVEGAASRMIANFKHLLEHHIIAIMSNAVVHNIKMLRTLSRCEPMLLGQQKPKTFLSYPKFKAKKEDNGIEFQKASQSDSENDKSNNINANYNMSQNYLQQIPPSKYSSEVLSGGIISGKDKFPFQIVTHDNDSNNLIQNKEDISQDTSSSKEKINSPNNVQSIEDNNHSQGDKLLESSHSLNEDNIINTTNRNKSNEYNDRSENESEFISEVEKTDTESGSVNENTDINSSNDDNFNNTKYPNIADGFTVTRNDSVELELSGTDILKRGKYKLTREEKLKLIKE